MLVTMKNLIITYRKQILLLYVLLPLIGLVMHHNPVPILDMWDGYLDFYVQLLKGDHLAWFSQHNEHRIVFSKILFYIDLHFFNGSVYFLLIANYLLAASIAWVILTLIDRIFMDQNHLNTLKWLQFLTLFTTFSWVQQENLIWGFQSQFFAVYLFALLAFFFYVEFYHKRHLYLFILSLISGVIATGTMVNGVLVLPILLILSAVLRTELKYTLLIMIVTAVMMTLYFYNYHTPSNHPSFVEGIKRDPIEVLEYFFAYLGGLFYWISGKGLVLFAQIMGVLLLVLSLFFAFASLRGKTSPYYYVALSFLLFFGGTALATSGGRAFLGVEQAFSGRYETPVLIAWTLLTVMVYHYFYTHKRELQYLTRVLIFFGVIFFIYQFRVFKSHDLYNQYVGALALEMNIRDVDYVSTFFPHFNWVQRLAKEPIKRDLSIFGNELIKDQKSWLDKRLKSDDLVINESSALGRVVDIKSVKNYKRVEALMPSDSHISYPTNLYLINDQQEIVGVLIADYKDRNIFNIMGASWGEIMIKGYLKKSAFGANMMLAEIQSNTLWRFNYAAQ
jgi:hypothetical protein